MAKKAYIGVDGVARKVKKGYVGVESTARRIRKAYIGIGGTARPCWSGGEPAYYGTITELGTVGDYGAAAVGEYALFATKDSTSKAVYAYDPSLTQYVPTALSKARTGLRTAAIGDYALIAGGSLVNTVDVYDTELTRTNPVTLSSKRYDMAAGNNASYVLVGGGSNGSVKQSAVDAFDKDLVRTTTALSSASYAFASGNSQYALFRNSTYLDAYDTALTKTVAANAITKWTDGDGVVFCDRAVFGGGTYSDSITANVEIIDTSLVRTSATPLSVARKWPGAVVLGDFAMFIGGYLSSGQSTAVDVYDSDFTQSHNLSLPQERGAPSAVTGNYAICAGGHSNSATTNTAEAFVLI